MGHLPCLMFIREKCQVSLDECDRFGNSVLDLALHHRHLYCFIYLYYACGLRQVNKH